MGLGDVKLAAVAGAWLEWVDLPIAVDIAAISALAAALIRRVRGDGFDPQAKLPFGAFFAPAIWICWLLAAWRGDWASPRGEGLAFPSAANAPGQGGLSLTKKIDDFLPKRVASGIVFQKGATSRLARFMVAA